MQPDWFVDPLGRFDGRFFDGERWTNQVSQGGVAAIDPDWPLPEPSSGGRSSQPARDDRRRPGGDPRQIDMRVDVDRRGGDRRTQIETAAATESQAQG